MAPPKSPARRTLDQYLADGEWHDRANAIDHIAPHVPPGQAIRRAHRLRAHQADRRGQQGAAINPSNSRRSDDQAVGARDIARNAIRVASDIEQTTTPDGTVLIRRAEVT